MKKLSLLLAIFILLCSFSKEPFKKEGKHIIFEVENTDLSDIKIDVTDEQSRVLYSETITHRLNIRKNFNFEYTFPGTYTIKITDGDVKYIRVVKI